MTGADLSGIHLVVAEVFSCQHTVLVAHQAVLADQRRVELDLDLHVPGHGVQRGAHLVHQHLLRFEERVDVCMIAVAMVGELLHELVVVVATTESQRGQGHPRGALAFDEVHQCLVVDRTDIEIAVGGEDHTVDAALDEALAGLGVRQGDPGRAVGRAAGLEAVDGSEDLRLLVSGRGFEHDTGRARIGHEAQTVITIETPGQKAQRLLEQGQLVRRLHRARHIHQEHQVGRREIGLGHVPGADTDTQQSGGRVPRARADLGGGAEGHVPALRQRIGIAEVVDELFDPHRIGLRQAPLDQDAADVGIGTGIDVDAEGRHRLLQGALEGVVVEMGIALTIHRRRHHDTARRHGVAPGQIALFHRLRSAGRGSGQVRFLTVRFQLQRPCQGRRLFVDGRGGRLDGMIGNGRTAVAVLPARRTGGHNHRRCGGDGQINRSTGMFHLRLLVVGSEDEYGWRNRKGLTAAIHTRCGTERRGVSLLTQKRKMRNVRVHRLPTNTWISGRSGWISTPGGNCATQRNPADHRNRHGCAGLSRCLYSRPT